MLDTCGFLQRVFNNTVVIACLIYTLLKSVNHPSLLEACPTPLLLSRHLLQILPPCRAQISWRQALLMSPSLYTSQIILINDDSSCTHVSVCPRLVFNLPWGWLPTQHERTSHTFSSLSELAKRKRETLRRKQRRFQESLMSTRWRSLANYLCLSFSLFSSLYHLSVPSFSRSPGGNVIVLSHAVVSRLSGGDHVFLWRE